MVNSSKILTVTYGTFSCSLEGFDDPFTTLQMVAEYFRTLAAEDPYFGGAPQTPDATTLKSIAQRNGPDGIDAVVSEDGIILRQTELATDPGVGVEAEEEILATDSIQNSGDAAAPEHETQEVTSDIDSILPTVDEPEKLSGLLEEGTVSKAEEDGAVFNSIRNTDDAAAQENEAQEVTSDPDATTLKSTAQKYYSDGIDAVASEDGIILRQTELATDTGVGVEAEEDVVVTDSIQNTEDAATPENEIQEVTTDTDSILLTLDELDKLGDLLEKGVINEAEFAKLKERILETSSSKNNGQVVELASDETQKRFATSHLS
jgi:hypothetical protein